MFLKLFLGYFNFFFIFKFYLGPNFFHSHSYVSGLVLPPFLTFVPVFVVPFKKKQRVPYNIISYRSLWSWILYNIIPFYLFLILSVEGSKTNY